MAVNFYLDKRTDKKGEAPIRASISIGGTRLVSSCGKGYKIAPDKWNESRQRVKHGSRNEQGFTYNTINERLSLITTSFDNYANECEANKIKPDRVALIAKLDDCLGRERKDDAQQEKPKGFFDYWSEFVAEKGKANEWTTATYQKFDALKNHITQWNKNVSFDNFNEKGLTAFVDFMREHLGMLNSTIGKQLGFLKWFLRWASVKGYNEQRAFLTFNLKLKTARNKLIFLDWQELMTVYNFEIPANGTEVTLKDTATGKNYAKTVHDAGALKKTRDIFCFCAFTSLRYSDAVRLKRSNIDAGKMTITTKKTNDTLTIELNKYALSILEKYKDTTFPDGKALPQISNQKMNEYLKDLCELAGINQQITQTYYRGNERFDITRPKYALMGTHAGRRTFICNALMLGIPPQMVMKWTGHSDYKSMKPYIDVTDAAKAKAMDLFNQI